MVYLGSEIMTTLGPVSTATDLESLWRTYSREIYGYLFKIVRDHDVTGDLVSTVYLRAAVALSNGHGCHTSESGWIFAIARSVMLDHWRAMRRVTFVDIDSMAEHAAEELPLDEQIEHTLMLSRVRRAVAELPDLQATVTTWRMCGYEYEDLAAALGKSYGAVKAIQVRAYAGLRERLEAV
jgi:RNA polymerase sigma-70 factor (ECF subfamily)